MPILLLPMLIQICLILFLGNSEDHWRKNGTNCFFPVHDRLNFFGAWAHCKKMKSIILDAGNSSKALLSTVFKKNTTLIWTGKLYERVYFEPGANWTWLNGSVFEEWDRWQIVFSDVSCHGCGFWKNGTIQLTSNCSQRISYFCEKDRGRKLQNSKSFHCYFTFIFYYAIMCISFYVNSFGLEMSFWIVSKIEINWKKIYFPFPKKVLKTKHESLLAKLFSIRISSKYNTQQNFHRLHVTKVSFYHFNFVHTRFLVCWTRHPLKSRLTYKF